jgi:hypothetical protein
MEFVNRENSLFCTVSCMTDEKHFCDSDINMEVATK